MTREPSASENSRTENMETDQVLIARVIDGDNASFDILVTRYRDRIYRVLRQMLRDGQEAEDLAQEVFVRAYHGLRRFRGECNFFTWLYRIAANVLYTQTRRAARRREIHDRAGREIVRSSACLTPADHAEREEIREWVRRALPHIDPRLREVLVLRDIEGYEVEEVARMLQVPKGTVKSRLFRAREDLRRLIQTFWDPEEKEVRHGV